MKTAVARLCLDAVEHVQSTKTLAHRILCGWRHGVNTMFDPYLFSGVSPDLFTVTNVHFASVCVCVCESVCVCVSACLHVCLHTRLSTCRVL